METGAMTTPPRFWLFAGDKEKCGGYLDYQGDYETLEEAEQAGTGYEWFHILDVETRQVVG